MYISLIATRSILAASFLAMGLVPAFGFGMEQAFRACSNPQVEDGDLVSELLEGGWSRYQEHENLFESLAIVHSVYRTAIDVAHKQNPDGVNAMSLADLRAWVASNTKLWEDHASTLLERSTRNLQAFAIDHDSNSLNQIFLADPEGANFVDLLLTNSGTRLCEFWFTDLSAIGDPKALSSKSVGKLDWSSKYYTEIDSEGANLTVYGNLYSQETHVELWGEKSTHPFNVTIVVRRTKSEPTISTAEDQCTQESPCFKQFVDWKKSDQKLYIEAYLRRSIDTDALSSSAGMRITVLTLLEKGTKGDIQAETFEAVENHLVCVQEALAGKGSLSTLLFGFPYNIEILARSEPNGSLNYELGQLVATTCNSGKRMLSSEENLAFSESRKN